MKAPVVCLQLCYVGKKASAHVRKYVGNCMQERKEDSKYVSK